MDGLTVLLFVGPLIILLFLRVPVGSAMLLVGLVAAILMLGVDNGVRQVVRTVAGSLNSFVLVPVPLFIFMGEILYRSGVSARTMTNLESVLGRIPGRLGLLAVATGTLLGVLSGSTIANTALLGSTLVPQMRCTGYSPRLAVGSVLASGGLAMIIPPSALAVLWGATAGVPVGPLLIAGLLPGLLMAFLYSLVIIVWARAFKGEPANEVAGAAESIRPDWRKFAQEVLPLVSLIGLTVGAIFFGVATPSEAAALGAVGAVLVVVAYRAFTVSTLREALIASLRSTVMIFYILIGAKVFSGMFGLGGGVGELLDGLQGLAVSPTLMLVILMAIVMVLGTFLDQVSIMFLTLPIFMPIVVAQGWDEVWFGIVMLIVLQIALTTPPLGISLFVMRGVTTDISLGSIYAAAVPFVGADLIAVTVVAVFPIIATWLPRLM